MKNILKSFQDIIHESLTTLVRQNQLKHHYKLQVYKEKSNAVAMEKMQNGQVQVIDDEQSEELERRTIAMIDKINRVL